MKRQAALLILAALITFGALTNVSQAQTGPLSLPQTLIIGSTGADVSALQGFLKERGFFNYPTITGYFGPITEAAVIAFQRDNDIDPIGIVGPLTRARIAFLSAQSASPGISAPVATTTSTRRSGGRPHRSNDASSSYVLGGTVSGLSGTGLILQNNGGDALAISGNGSFVFGTQVASGGAYSVTVLANPSSPSQTCVVSNGSGTIGEAAVTNVSVTCTTLTYTVTPNGDGHESITPSTAQTVEEGSTQSFTVVADSGYTRSNVVGGTCASGSWVGNVYTTGVITSHCIVSFSATPISYQLSITKTGNGTGQVVSTPSGINCGSTCTVSYEYGTNVVLSASPDPGVNFGGWSGGGCSGTGFCTVSIMASTSISALFFSLFDA